MTGMAVAAQAHGEPQARIGPNAIIQVAEALRHRLGPADASRLFDAAGLTGWLTAPPTDMVDEACVTVLHGVVRDQLDVETAAAVFHDAGRRTADYLLAHRIPRPVQPVLKGLPPSMASRLLLAAITRHSWTFAGSGRFAVLPGRPLKVSIEGCPLCGGAASATPQCAYYAGTFERLYRVLVSRRTVVTETACQALGDRACEFTLDWSRR